MNLVSRLFDQALDAIALVYGLAHGAALSTLAASAAASSIRRETSATTVAAAVALAVLVGVTVFGASRLRRSRSLAALCAVTILLTLQHYAVYALAYALRTRASSIFGSRTPSLDAVVAPLIIVGLIASAASALRYGYGVAPHSMSFSLLERFVEAVAFTYGLAEAPRSEFIGASLAIIAVIVACVTARDFIAARGAPAPPRPSLPASQSQSSLLHAGATTVDFIEQYSLFVATRLIYASPFARVSSGSGSNLPSTHSVAPLLTLGIISALYQAATSGGGGAAETSRLALGASIRRLTERFLDAIAIVAALVDAQRVASTPGETGFAVEMLYVVGVSLVVETAIKRHNASASARAWIAQVAALATRYALYALVQLLSGRLMLKAASRSLSETVLGALLLIALVASVKTAFDATPHTAASCSMPVSEAGAEAATATAAAHESTAPKEVAADIGIEIEAIVCDE